MLEELKIISSNKIKNSHISLLMLGRDGSKFRAFAWNSISTPLEEFLSVKNKKKFNIAGKMRLNEWRGKKNIHFIIEDISLS